MMKISKEDSVDCRVWRALFILYMKKIKTFFRRKKLWKKNIDFWYMFKESNKLL